jgi:dihydroorotase
VRIIPFVNVSFGGLTAFGTGVPECEDERLLDVVAAVAAAGRHPSLVAGVKVRVGQFASGAAGAAPLVRAIDVAGELGSPVMCHLDVPPPDRDAVLALLRPGDILTHCFRAAHGSDATGAFEARRRGVRFDVGHGGASFGFATARTMLDAGFAPDTISSDVHRYCVDGPAHDVLETMSKLRSLGMSTGDVITAATATPAGILGRSDIGTLQPGAAGDAVVLDEVGGRHEYHDTDGATFVGAHRFVVRGIVRAGRWLKPTHTG